MLKAFDSKFQFLFFLIRSHSSEWISKHWILSNNFHNELIPVYFRWFSCARNSLARDQYVNGNMSATKEPQYMIVSIHSKEHAHTLKAFCGVLSWWRHQMETFPRYWPFVRGIHRSPVNSPHKGQWRGALMFSLICVWINCCVNNRKAGDLRSYRAHCGVTVTWGTWTTQKL